MFGLKWGSRKRVEAEPITPAASPVVEAGAFKDIDFEKVFAQATITYVRETPLEEQGNDLTEFEQAAARNAYLLEGFLNTAAATVSWSDEATERALHSRLHPSVILTGYHVGDERVTMLDVEHTLAQEFLARSPETCRRLALAYGLGAPLSFDGLGNRRADVASFYLRRIGTLEEQKDRARRQELGNTSFGPIQLRIEDEVKTAMNRQFSLVVVRAVIDSVRELFKK